MSTLNVGTIKSIASNVPPVFQDSAGSETGVLVKAHCRWSGSSTIRNSFNVTSISDNGVGNFVVNFAVSIKGQDGTAESDISVALAANAPVNSTQSPFHCVTFIGSATSTTVNVETFNLNNSNLRADPNHVSVIVTA